MKIHAFAAAIMTAVTSITLASITAAHALSISLVPTTPISVNAGDTVSFDVVMDFRDDPTIGGGFDILFDPTLLQFDSFVNNVIGDPGFSRDPDILPGLLDSWVFGDFNGLSGPLTVGSISFTALPGLVGLSAFITLSADENIAGPFFSSITFAQQIVDFDGAEVQGLAATAVPLPAALPLFIMGIAGVGAAVRRRKGNAVTAA